MNGYRLQWCIEDATRSIVHLNVERSNGEISSMEQIINVHIETLPDVPEGILRAILKPTGITPKEFAEARQGNRTKV